MPRFRPDITALNPYRVGRQLDDVAREHGLDPGQLVKLTANEGPDGPFPGAMEAASVAMAQSNRYPDNDCWQLGHALADELGVEFDQILFGAGSVALLAEAVTAVGGPGTKVVYGWPSFIMYRFAAIWAGSDYEEVPLDERWSLDLDAMREAVDPETTAVFVCNPNNPTGTIKKGDEIEEFVASVPESVLVVIDEAYHEFVVHADYRTAIPLAVTRPNVMVLRTFSKIYGLAGLRVGYAVGTAELIAELRKVQAPLTVNRVAQAAALASVGQADELSRRREENAARRGSVVGALADRGIPMAESHTNFVFFDLGADVDRVVADMTTRGVLIRPMAGGWVRATIGDDVENGRLVEALDATR